MPQWDKSLVHAAGQVIGLEARGLHNGLVHDGNRGGKCNGCGVTAFAPNLNAVRDPRWGRAQEVFGEDPAHMAGLVKRFVTGLQNNSLGHSTDANGQLLAAACCKHFAAYDIENIPAARQDFSANVTPRNMWETYMPAFEACIVEAKAAHVMCAYNSINGIPTSADPLLLTIVPLWTWALLHAATRV